MGKETSKQFGFLGAGAIGEVLVRRLIASGTATAERVLAFDINAPILARLAADHGIRTVGSNAEVAAEFGFLFVAVPPAAVLPVLREVAPVCVRGGKKPAHRPGGVQGLTASARSGHWASECEKIDVTGRGLSGFHMKSVGPE